MQPMACDWLAAPASMGEGGPPQSPPVPALSRAESRWQGLSSSWRAADKKCTKDQGFALLLKINDPGTLTKWTNKEPVNHPLLPF